MPSIGVPLNSGDGPFLGTGNKEKVLQGLIQTYLLEFRPYPRGPKQAGLEGYVTMAVTIQPDGTVFNVSVIESNPKRLFDKAAIAAMKHGSSDQKS